jgi:NADH-quinone oxidoreductase subunit H
VSELLTDHLHALGPVAAALIAVAVAAGVFLPIVSATALLGIWGERKISARLQSRIGPNRVGKFGLLQSVADGIKLILKEDLIPDAADRWLFRLAPYLAFVPVFAAFVGIPFGPEFAFEPRLSAGVFWILAVLGVEVIGVILAGWASNNKWSVFGAMREACQMVCYEIPLGLSIVVAVMTAGTLNLVRLGLLQGGGLHTWLVFRNPFVLLSFVVYFIAGLASNKRAPFDLPESESELVAGFHTEYSGLRFSLFFFAEYAGMFVVSAIQTGVFLGAWNDPFGLIGYWHARHHTVPAMLAINVLAAGIFAFKCVILVVIQMWVRWSLPRPRIDQVLYACIKVLLPLSALLLIGGAFWQLFLPERGGVPWVDYQPWDARDWVRHGTGAAWITQAVLAAGGLAAVLAICGRIVHAFVTGRADHTRLGPVIPPAGFNVPPARLSL